MTTDVRADLARLAERGPAGEPPADLWRRGVRRRRRRLGAAVAASVLAVLAGGGLAGSLGDRVAGPPRLEPATTGSAAIPDRIELPGGWTPGTERKGPPGPLAMVGTASRNHGLLGSSDEVFGVSATTGEYQFLDLPGLLRPRGYLLDPMQPRVALSPDGRSLAYWVGDTMPGAGDLGPAAVGVAVWDTVTGRVVRHAFASPSGLTPALLAWSGPSSVVLQFGRIDERTADSLSVTYGKVRLWSPASGRVSLVPTSTTAAPPSSVEPGGGALWGWSGSQLLRWSLPVRAGDPTRTRVTGLTGRDGSGDLGVDASGRGFAVVSESSRGGRLFVGALPVDGARVTTARPLRLEGAGRRDTVRTVVGWRDASHVLVQASPGLGSSAGGPGVYAVDVATGALTRVVRLPTQQYGPEPSWATDLWSVPTQQRPGPASVLDPRLTGTGVAAAVVLLGWAGLCARTRRGRR